MLRSGRCTGGDGQVVPLVALVVVLAVVLTLVVVRIGGSVDRRARARTAADAAALAGAGATDGDGEDAARSIAEANEGTLESFVVVGSEVEVVVRVDDERATARARRSW